jgi:hypothetical protein
MMSQAVTASDGTAVSVRPGPAEGSASDEPESHERVSSEEGR